MARNASAKRIDAAAWHSDSDQVRLGALKQNERRGRRSGWACRAATTKGTIRTRRADEGASRTLLGRRLVLHALSGGRGRGPATTKVTTPRPDALTKETHRDTAAGNLRIHSRGDTGEKNQNAIALLLAAEGAVVYQRGCANPSDATRGRETHHSPSDQSAAVATFSLAGRSSTTNSIRIAFSSTASIQPKSQQSRSFATVMYG